MSILLRRLRRGALTAAIAGLALAPALTPAQSQQVRLICPYGFFLQNGLCYPYSWSGVDFAHDVAFPNPY